MSVTFGPKQGLIISGATGDVHDVALRALLRALDQELFLSIKNRTTTAPPGSPTNGDAYIVATGGSGAWSGHDKHVAVWTTDNPVTPSGLWEFYVPKAGWLAYSVADAAFYSYSGSAWAAFAGGGGGATAFTGLSDVPASYAGAAHQVVAVNAGETALEFVSSGGGGGTSLAAGGRRSTRILNQDGAEMASGSHLGDYCQGLGNVNSGYNAPDATHGANSTRYSFGAVDTYCGWYGGAQYRNPRHIDSLFWAFVVRTTDVRFWVGFSTAGSSLSVSATPSGSYAMFRFSSIDGDTNFQACTSDGSSQTVVDTGIAGDTAMHRFGILFDDATPGVKFYIDGVLVATITTHVPGTVTLVYTCFANWHSGDSFPLGLVGFGGCSIDSDM